jgi:hypothetical protein
MAWILSVRGPNFSGISDPGYNTASIHNRIALVRSMSRKFATGRIRPSADMVS